MKFIDLAKQYSLYAEEIQEAIKRVCESGQFILGPEMTQLEQQLARYVGTQECIGVANATEGLQLSLMALGVGPGDEVITSPFSWVSGAEVIRLLGAHPVFIDIRLDTFAIDETLLEGAITTKTKAFLIPSLFGQTAHFKEINAIANQYGFPVIEDGAQSFGATHFGRKSCSLTTIGVTSFFPSKTLGAYGDGGAIFTNDEELAKTLRLLRTHGGSRDDFFYVGLNSRLDSLQAAILLVKFKHFPKELKQRANLAQEYHEILSPCYETPKTRAGNTHAYNYYIITGSENTRERLEHSNIPCRLYFPKCIHEFAPYRQFATQGYPNAEHASRTALALPFHPWMSLEEKQELFAACTYALS